MHEDKLTSRENNFCAKFFVLKVLSKNRYRREKMHESKVLSYIIRLFLEKLLKWLIRRIFKPIVMNIC